MTTFRLIIFYLFLTFPLFSSQLYCLNNDVGSYRSEYSIGDTLSIEDQNYLFPICNGIEDYYEGENFSLADLNGNVNGGDYKITLISMNATW